MKRFLDTLLILLTAPLWLPLLVLTAVAVRINMGAPVLFCQQRPGLRGRPFVLLKFRTMRVGAGSDAERLTPFGRWLRRTSLDELPQLWNVLRGDMALVGPRPLLMEYLPRYFPGQARRHEVRPGITGWAQAQGRNEVPWEERLRYDTWYVDHQSIWLDLRILLMTVREVVVRRRGITAKGEATMSVFQGRIEKHEHRTVNVQHRTSNADSPVEEGCAMFDAEKRAKR
jgi:lipopolysaccharide/colanic/teichoic acid biosynthesis glycosyltransferase